MKRNESGNTQVVERAKSEPALNDRHAGERPDLPKFAPSVDIFDQGDDIVLVADMPGVAADGVEVNLDRGTLTIRGRVAPLSLRGQLVLEEFRVGDFVRTFEVSPEIDSQGIEAELKNGVLVLHLRKAAESKPRKIEVKTA